MQEFQIVGMWIGLTQQNGANWLWVDNKDWTYLNWAPSMPERYRGVNNGENFQHNNLLFYNGAYRIPKISFCFRVMGSNRNIEY